ncbi:MAG: sugar transferase, partial [Cyclobacteriaceae bacterium]
MVCEKIFMAKNKSNQDAAFIKIKDDPRVTKVGKFIRNTSIDELPQLWNVLKGDMSLVGNRPLPLYEAEKITTVQQAVDYVNAH